MRATLCEISLLVSVFLPGFALAQLPPSRQLVVVTTSNWNATGGVLRRFERRGNVWRRTGPDIPVMIGRNGLAWGRGLQTTPPRGPQKQEGDGKSPAGIFRLPSAFGFAAPQDVPQIRLPYVQLTGTVECVDDTNSFHYNTIVDRKAVARPDWNSSEKMRRVDPEYQIGVVVAQNSDPAELGAGSCIFLHVWESPGSTTSGCTAMALDSMQTLAAWLDPAAHPLLAQMPEAEYRRRQSSWHLPRLVP